jgi:hypothetical protein
LIGGTTPKYLVGNAPKDIKEHVGTTDLDVVVGVSLSTEEEEAYRTLQQNLNESGFAPATNPENGREVTFRWVRDVDGVNVALDVFAQWAMERLSNCTGIQAKTSAQRSAPSAHEARNWQGRTISQ